jgi:hypothetical protein
MSDHDLPTPEQGPVRWNGCKHVRSLDRKNPNGHAAQRKAKRKAQRAARKVKP